MNSHEIELVQSACEELLLDGAVFADRFFDRLHDLDPTRPHLCTASCAAAPRHFANAFATVVSELRHLDRVLPLLRSLAEQYCRPTTVASDLARVRAALTWAMYRCRATALPPAGDAWDAACEMVVARLLDSMRRSPSPSETYPPPPENIHRGRTNTEEDDSLPFQAAFRRLADWATVDGRFWERFSSIAVTPVFTIF